MASWNSVTLSDSTKTFAWNGIMQAFKEDSNVPPYARALLELLIEERREMLETQQKMMKIMDGMGRKVAELSSVYLNACQSSSEQTPVNSESSNETAATHGVGVQHGASTTVEIVSGEPLYYDHFPSSSLLTAKIEFEEDPVEDEDYPVHKAKSSTPREVTTASLPSRRKRPLSTGDTNGCSMAMAAAAAVAAPTDLHCRYQDCEQSFDSASLLQQHVKKHTYKQKYHCPVCGLGIRSETRLRDHMNQHTGERPYVCEYCGKGFTRTDAKNGHLKKCAEREARPLIDLQQLIGDAAAAAAAQDQLQLVNDDELDYYAS